MASLAKAAKRAARLQRLAAFKSSGLTRTAWCVREGVPLSTLAYWQRQQRAETAQCSLVPIMVRAISPARSEALSGVVSIEVAGLRVRADAAMDAQWLALLLRELR